MKWFVALMLCLPLAAFAQNAQPTATDPVANKRAVELAEQLRCLVCQNQTIADSNAELAVDLRGQIRAQIAQGKSDAEITAFMVERYGEFVLYKPPVKSTTLLLWLGPPVLLLAAIGGLFGYLRGRRKRVEIPPLSDEERRQAQLLLGGRAGGEAK